MATIPGTGYTELNDQKLPMKQLKLDLPSQPSPRQAGGPHGPPPLVETFGGLSLILFTFCRRFGKANVKGLDNPLSAGGSRF
jgi:hypothetical protein